MIRLDSIQHPSQNAAALFNSSARFGDLIALADSRHNAAFLLSVRNTLGTPSSMAGRGGDTREGMPVPSAPVRQPCPVPAPSVWRRMAGLTCTGGHHA